jgi:multiple sugar transport system permease protein
MASTRKLRFSNIIDYSANYLLAIAYSLIIIIPVYYVLVSSFKSNIEIFSSPLAFPGSWNFGNFIKAQAQVNLAGAILFSATIVFFSELLCLSLGFLAAYAIAHFRIKEASWVESFFGVGFLVPAFAVLVPVFLLAVQLKLLYKPIFLVLFYSAYQLPLTVVILAAYIRQIPREFEESAEIDGASFWQILRHIVFPLTKTGVVTVLVLNFLSFWNEYLFALILLAKNTRTIQLALPLLKSQRLADYGLVAAGVVISLIPVYIVFIFFQDRIISGLLEGGVKG